MSSSSASLIPPPRAVPLLLRAQLLVGGFLNQFGWIFFGFGMIFAWLFAAQSDPAAWIDFSGELETAPGVVTGCSETNASEGGSKHSRGNPIYAHQYDFRIKDARFSGVSYSTRRQEAGADVTIEFPKGSPGRSRIEGMRTALFPPWVLFVLLFPLIGAAFITVGFWRGRRAIRLLKWGQPALGTLKDKEATSVRVNNRPVYKLTFEFLDDAGTPRHAIAKTHQTELLEDDASELLVYDPWDPSQATLLDHLPGSPRVDEFGMLHAPGLSAALVLVIPLASLFGHGIYAWLRFVA
jgi:hypothetical protein